MNYRYPRLIRFLAAKTGRLTILGGTDFARWLRDVVAIAPDPTCPDLAENDARARERSDLIAAASTKRTRDIVDLIEAETKRLQGRGSVSFKVGLDLATALITAKYPEAKDARARRDLRS